ncbi:MAG: hypothetical protein CBE00_00100 [Planctomycetaceae bacterium TMED240]|nr:hypothetical protein [Rhodopirellula sp.]OUX09108.1 MAG: hypothetical protein CBE00_00100 [Planctomycetaceae bacterium TMED240]
MGTSKGKGCSKQENQASMLPNKTILIGRIATVGNFFRNLPQATAVITKLLARMRRTNSLLLSRF